MNHPRTLAVRVLTRVLSDAEPLDEALAAALGEVPSESIGWLQEICSGTLRWKGRLDWILDSISARKKPSGWLRKMLLISAYQLVAQDRVSPAQVVSETVNEIKKKEGEAPSRFANACLRKIGAQALAWRNQGFPNSAQAVGAHEDQREAIAQAAQAAAWASLPQWFWAKLVHQHGVDWARAYAEACMQRPSLWMRAKDAGWTTEGTQAGPIPGSFKQILQNQGPLPRRPGFAEGAWIVQDISSQVLVSEVVNEIRKSELGKGGTPLHALDLCAAPGGKAVGLAWSGLHVTATDIRQDRAGLLQETIARAAPDVKYLPWSEGVENENSTTYDLVWVDAPCSGSGIIRRHPDVRWLKGEQELAQLKLDQRKVVEMGWKRVKPGGYLVYSVCSVFKDEGPGIVRELTHSVANAGGHAERVQEWLLCPQVSPYGDGFWAGLVRKG